MVPISHLVAEILAMLFMTIHVLVSLMSLTYSLSLTLFTVLMYFIVFIVLIMFIVALVVTVLTALVLRSTLMFHLFMNIGDIIFHR